MKVAGGLKRFWFILVKTLEELLPSREGTCWVLCQAAGLFAVLPQTCGSSEAGLGVQAGGAELGPSRPAAQEPVPYSPRVRTRAAWSGAGVSKMLPPQTPRARGAARSLPLSCQGRDTSGSCSSADLGT